MGNLSNLRKYHHRDTTISLISLDLTDDDDLYGDDNNDDGLDLMAATLETKSNEGAL